MADKTPAANETPDAVAQLTELNETLSGMLQHYQQLHADEVFKNAQLTAKLQLASKAKG